MRSYIRSLWVPVVCAVVLSGAPGVAVAHEANPSSGSSGTTAGPMATIMPTLTTSELSSSDQLAISVSPTSGSPGTVVTVRGTGWTHQVYADGVEVEISQNYGNGQLTRLTSAKSGPPDANGTFSLHMTIPATAKPGLLSISPITGGPEIADALFTVKSGGASSGQAHPSVTLSPSNGPRGTVTTADGHGFIPNQSVTVTQSGGPGVTGGGGTIQADQSGSIKMSFRIADQTPPGDIKVTFTQGANATTAQFRVSPNSGVAQPGQDPQPVNPSGSTESRANKAISWANTQLGKHDWDWKCEVFVEAAYGTTFQKGSAQDAFTAFHTSASLSPNVGALVWFKPNADNRNAGHVGIYLGNDQFISATSNGVAIRTITNWSKYVASYEGWGDAPASWPGR